MSKLNHANMARSYSLLATDAIARAAIESTQEGKRKWLEIGLTHVQRERANWVWALIKLLELP